MREMFVCVCECLMNEEKKTNAPQHNPTGITATTAALSRLPVDVGDVVVVVITILSWIKLLSSQLSKWLNCGVYVVHTI